MMIIAISSSIIYGFFAVYRDDVDYDEYDEYLLGMNRDGHYYN